MHIHIEQEDLITAILAQIAHERHKSIERIKRLLLIKQNATINRRFWEIVDETMPVHTYQYVGCCAECGSLELRENPPPARSN